MKIKICGLTHPKEAEYLNNNHVDFAGIVMFFPKSKRNATPEQASRILNALSPEIKRVAVVVSPTLEQALIIEQLGFDYIQIHGNISELLADIKLPVLKAFNISDMQQYDYLRSFPQIVGYVFDAQEPGSGKTFDWSLVKNIPRDGKLLLLAGGLTPDNAADAISNVAPDGLDVSSGVEYDDGTGKDPEKVERFVKNIRQLKNSHL